MKRILQTLLMLGCTIPVLAQGNGTLVGSPTFGPAKFSNGLTGATDASYISLPTGTFPTSSYVTWEAWLKTSGTATSVALSSPVGATDAFWMGEDSSIGNIGDFGFGQGSKLLDSLIHIADGNWHHCVVEFTPTMMYTFVDGVAGASYPYTFVAPASTAMAIGRYESPGYGWSGSIDEVAIWNFQKYAPAAQGTQAYTVPTAPYVGNESGLVALYHLQADGTDSAALRSSLAITTTTLPAGSIGGAYSQTLAATGGTSPYTWSLSSGALPAGLSLAASTGVISGTPTTAGTASFVAGVRDNVGDAATSPLSITITNGTTYGPYNGTLLGSPTFGPAKFSNGLTGASDASYISLPTGTFPTSSYVTWEAWLKTSGTATSVALSSPVGGTDAFWMGDDSSTGNIGDFGFGQGSKLLDSLIHIADGNWHHCVVEFTPTMMYTFVDGVAGASSPYTFVAPSSTAMAIGRYESAGYGWSGSIDEVAIWNFQKYAPAAQGTHVYTVPTAPYVGNESGLVALYHLQADGTDSVGLGTGLAITTTTLPAGSIGGAYSQTLAATGGTSPYTWSLSSGALPAGLSLAASTGVISGTPTTAGTASFVAEVRDSVGDTATSALSITIANSTTISPSNSSIIYSPFNWNVQNGVASTINSGAYFRTIFSGTSAALATNTASDAAPYPQIWARVDNQGWQLFTLNAGNPLLTVATGLSGTQKHMLEVVVKSTSEGLTRWPSSQTIVQLTGIVLDGGATVTAPNRRSRNVLIYGDSITEGYHVLGAGDVNTSDALGCYSYALATALDAEVGVVGFGGTGVTVAGGGGVPDLPSSYNYIYGGVSRSFNSPAPDLVIYNEGTNDSASITAGLEQVINAIRTSAPNSKHLILVPFNQTHISDIQAAVAAIGSANVTYQSTSGWFSTTDSVDGVHPYNYSSVYLIAPKLFPVVEGVLYPVTGP